jgi:hypothetical protein
VRAGAIIAYIKLLSAKGRNHWDGPYLCKKIPHTAGPFPILFHCSADGDGEDPSHLSGGAFHFYLGRGGGGMEDFYE